jgi:ATP-binding cassette subfamily F protein 3
MSNIVYEFRDQKIKEYLGDVNYSWSNAIWKTCVKSRKDALKAASPRK